MRSQPEHTRVGVMVRAKAGIMSSNSKMKNLSLREFKTHPTRITLLINSELEVKSLAGVSAKSMYFPSS